MKKDDRALAVARQLLDAERANEEAERTASEARKTVAMLRTEFALVVNASGSNVAIPPTANSTSTLPTPPIPASVKCVGHATGLGSIEGSLTSRILRVLSDDPTRTISRVEFERASPHDRANAIRAALASLAAESLIERVGRGVYRLAAKSPPQT